MTEAGDGVAPGRGAYRWAVAIVVVGYAGLGVAVLAAARAMALSRAERWWMVVAVVALAPALLTLIHEAGHAWAARRAGMHIMGVRVGRLDVRRTRRAWRWRWSPERAQTRGVLETVPAVGGHDLGTWRALFAAGPLASALFGVVAMLAAGVLAMQSPGIAWLLAGLGVASLLAHGLANTLPYQVGQYRSDGAWWRALRAPAALEEIGMRLKHVEARLLAGQSTDDVPSGVLDALHAAHPLVGPMAVASLRAHDAAGRGDWPAVERIGTDLAETLRAQPGGDEVWEALFAFRVEVAIATLASTGEGRALREALDALRPEQRRWLAWELPWLIPRAEAALAFADGDTAAAERSLAESAAHAEDSPYASTRLTEAGVRSHLRAWRAGTSA